MPRFPRGTMVILSPTRTRSAGLVCFDIGVCVLCLVNGRGPYGPGPRPRSPRRPLGAVEDEVDRRVAPDELVLPALPVGAIEPTVADPGVDGGRAHADQPGEAGWAKHRRKLRAPRGVGECGTDLLS